MSALQRVLPLSWTADDNKRVSLGGCKLLQLVERHESPLYVHCQATLEAQCRAFRDAFEAAYNGEAVIEYSSKALCIPEVLRVVSAQRVRVDVVSGGELAVAMASDVPPRDINFHGNCKSRRELQEAVDARIGCVTIDSQNEMHLLDAVAAERAVKQPVMLRVSPSVDPHTHLLTSTGVLDSKFGFSIETGAAEQAVRSALQLANLDVIGIHFHLGSPLFEVEPYVEAIEFVYEFIARMTEKYQLNLRRFSPGGGFAVAYTTDQHPPAPADYANAICNAVHAACAKHKLALPELVVEPGRSLIARSAVALYTIGSIKTVKGVRTYVSVDGGMGDNIRPSLYGAQYSVVSVSRPGTGETPDAPVRLVGKFCECSDILSHTCHLQSPQIGDVLAVACAGAYHISMASNYNCYLRPAVLMVKDGKAKVIQRRETYKDILQRFC